MGKVRVIQKPIFKPMRGQRLCLRKIRLTFNTLGAGQSALKGGETKPAELVFHASVLPEIREGSSGELKQFAKLKGEATLDAETRKFGFKLPDKPLEEMIEYDSELSEKVEMHGKKALRRCLKILLDGDDESLPFRNPTQLALLLPDEAQDYPGHLEIGTSIMIDGKEEAPIDKNDLVDMPLYPLLDAQVVFLMLDEKGEPMANAKIIVKHPDGNGQEETTDDNGELFFHADEGEEFEFIGLSPSQESEFDISRKVAERMSVGEPHSIKT